MKHDALCHPCPTCKQPSGASCVLVRGPNAGRPAYGSHDKRITLARGVPQQAERERILAIVEEIESHYPLDIFPEPEPGCAPDRYSAAMARRVCAQLRERINEG